MGGKVARDPSPGRAELEVLPARSCSPQCAGASATAPLPREGTLPEEWHWHGFSSHTPTLASYAPFCTVTVDQRGSTASQVRGCLDAAAHASPVLFSRCPQLAESISLGKMQAIWDNAFESLEVRSFEFFFFLYGLNLCTYESEACFSFSLLVSFLSKASKNQSFPRRFFKLFLKLRKIGKIIPQKLF